MVGPLRRATPWSNTTDDQAKTKTGTAQAYTRLGTTTFTVSRRRRHRSTLNANTMLLASILVLSTGAMIRQRPNSLQKKALDYNSRPQTKRKQTTAQNRRHQHTMSCEIDG